MERRDRRLTQVVRQWRNSPAEELLRAHGWEDVHEPGAYHPGTWRKRSGQQEALLGFSESEAEGWALDWLLFADDIADAGIASADGTTLAHFRGPLNQVLSNVDGFFLRGH